MARLAAEWSMEVLRYLWKTPLLKRGNIDKFVDVVRKQASVQKHLSDLTTITVHVSEVNDHLLGVLRDSLNEKLTGIHIYRDGRPDLQEHAEDCTTSGFVKFFQACRNL